MKEGKKFTLWQPGGAKLTKKQKQWLKEHPEFEIKQTAYYRGGMLNYLEMEKYKKAKKILDK